MPSDKASDYLLASGTDEMQRQQAKVWEPAASEFLATLNVSAGSRVLDLGCGAMGVLGLQLAAARSFVEEAMEHPKGGDT